jgi:hypothetical protein
MEQATSQKLSQLPAPKAKVLTANPIDTSDQAPACDNPYGGFREPVQTLTKPFDHLMPVCGIAPTDLTPSPPQEPNLFKTHLTDNQTKQSTQHVVDRPWATRSPNQPFKDAQAYPFNPHHHSDPLTRWQRESVVEGPYQMIGSVGVQQQTPSQSSRSNTKGTLDAPSHVSATRGSSWVGEQWEQVHGCPHSGQRQFVPDTSDCLSGP